MENSEIISLIEKTKFIAIVRGVTKEKIIPLLNAFYEGGIRVCEFPLNQKDPSSFTDTFEIVSLAKKEMGDKMAIGVGTVLLKEQAKLAKKYGAELIISPTFNKDVVKVTKKMNLVSIPGAFTPSEMENAYRAGADFVKLFPGYLGTAKYIKEILYPLSYLKILVFGGVTKENWSELHSAGAVGAGIQSGILNMEAIEKGDFATITNLCKSYTSLNEK